MSRKVYQIIQQRFIEMIEEAIRGDQVLPWKKPWSGGQKINYISRRPYRGVNQFLLPIGGEYITWSQIQKLREKDSSIQLKKGCKKHLVVYWNLIEKEFEKEDGETEIKKLPLLRYYSVYQISDCIGIESKVTNYSHENINKNAEAIIKDYVDREKIDFQEIEGDKACYYPTLDSIQVPLKKQFKNYSEYLSTCFHELAHSTGHPSRLNRFLNDEGIGLFKSESYSKEELVAELANSMILGSLNIQSEEVEKNSVAYLYGWLGAIRKDIRLIVEASAKAQRASDFILGGNFNREEED